MSEIEIILLTVFLRNIEDILVDQWEYFITRVLLKKLLSMLLNNIYMYRSLFPAFLDRTKNLHNA